jgi:hypothetical protein
MLDVPSDRAAQLIEYTASTRGQWLSGYPALLAQSRCLLAVAGQRRAARTESSGTRGQPRLNIMTIGLTSAFERISRSFVR